MYSICCVVNMVLSQDHFVNGNKLWYQQLMKKLAISQPNQQQKNSKNTINKTDKTITEGLKMSHNKFAGSLDWWRMYITSEEVARRCSVKKVFLKISQNSQEKVS